MNLLYIVNEYLARVPRIFNTVSSVNGTRKIGTFTCKIMTLDPYDTLLTKINSKWTEDSNVRTENIMLPLQKK